MIRYGMDFLYGFIVTFVFFSLIFIGLKKTWKAKLPYLNAHFDALFDLAEDIESTHTYSRIIKSIQLFEKTSQANVVLLNFTQNRLVYINWNFFSPLQIQQFEREFMSAKNGYSFFDSQLRQAKKKNAIGFVLKHEGTCLFVCFPYVKEAKSNFWQYLYTVFSDFDFRCERVDNFLNKTLLSRQLFAIEKMQYSFLPQELPKIDGIEVAAYFLPLITVSGDYYTVIPLNKTKTLLLLGDVSGKGLSAALVMGVIMHAVKEYTEKENLVGLLSQIDLAIKSMRLDDKFTVVFSGIIDISTMQLTYINAAVNDAYLFRKKDTTAQMFALSSSCSLLGIDGLSAVGVENMRSIAIKKGDVVVIASDGLSDLGHSSGNSFGEMPLYKELLRSSLEKPLVVFVNQLADTALKFAQTTALKDDITILAAKVLKHDIF